MRWRMTIGLAGCLLASGAAQGADPVSYQVQFAPSGDVELDKLLKQTSALVALRSKLPPAPFALIGRARADAAQFLIVLHSLGYDAGQVDITIDGKELSDPGLLAALVAAPAHEDATVHVESKIGVQFHIGQVVLNGLPPGFTPPPMVKTGDVALASPILDASPALQLALQNDGYAFANVGVPLAVATPATHTLNLTYSVAPGPRVNIGPIAFSGLKRTDPNFLRRHMALQPGQRFSAKNVSDARDSLLGLGVFSSVTAVPEPVVGDSAPILFRVIEQKRHAVSLSGSYATDTGMSVGTSWEDRNLFRHAETLTITATANGLGGTGTTAPGYDLKTVFTKPDYYARGQILTLSVEGLKESLTAYNRTAFLLGASLSRPITKHTAITFGPTFTSERVEQEGVSRTYVLLQFPISFIYNNTGSLLEPMHGINAGISLIPTLPAGGGSKPFVIVQGQAATYIPVEADGRGIIAMRIIAGTILGATTFEVPPDQRFYAGGSGTVRGYTYQTIGPLFPDDTPQGGSAMDAVNLEFRQHVWGNFGVVPFVDAGQVSSSSAPFTGTIRVGAGLGLRYYTGIGPIRVDLALPLSHIAGSGTFALYVGLGEAF
jgi:translocation and assembly module TamA